MGFILFIVLILGIVIIYAHQAEGNGEIRRQSYEKESCQKESVEYVERYSFKCLGGFKDMGACESCFIDLFDDRLKIKLYKKSSSGSILGSKEVEVKLTDITNLELQNESQIIERVSLGKMVVFGLLSLGMKGKEVEIKRELLVVTFNYQNEVVNLVLEDALKGSNSTFKFAKEANELRDFQAFMKSRNL